MVLLVRRTTHNRVARCSGWPGSFLGSVDIIAFFRWDHQVFDREVSFSGCARIAHGSSVEEGGSAGMVIVGGLVVFVGGRPVRRGGRRFRDGAGHGPCGRCPQFPQGLLQDIPEKNIPGAPTFPYSRKGKAGVRAPKVPTSRT